LTVFSDQLFVQSKTLGLAENKEEGWEHPDRVGAVAGHRGKNTRGAEKRLKS
jgi:hypothetical protein